MKYTSEQEESSINYTFNSGINSIKVEFYQAGGTTNIIDSEQITVLVQPDDLISAYITNESVVVPTRNDGTGGDYSNAITKFVLLRGKTDISTEEGWSFSATPSSGVTGTLKDNIYTVTNMTTDSGYVDISAEKEHYATMTKRLTIVKNKEALDGVPATAIWGTLSDQVVIKSKEGILNPQRITINIFSQTGLDQTISYKGKFSIFETLDNINWTKKYTSSNIESTKEYIISSNLVKAIKFEIYDKDGLGKIDELTVRVLSEGKDGEAGADGVNSFLHTAWANANEFPEFVKGARPNVLRRSDMISMFSNNATLYPNYGYWVTDDDGRPFLRSERANLELNPKKFSVYNTIGTVYNSSDPINSGDLATPIGGKKVVISGKWRASKEVRMTMMAKVIADGVTKALPHDGEVVTVPTKWKTFSTVLDNVDPKTSVIRFLPSSDTNGWDTSMGVQLDQKDLKIEIVEEGESEEPTPWIPPITRNLFNPTNIFEGGNTRNPVAFQGSVVTSTKNVEVPEWGAKDASTFVITGGTSVIKGVMKVKPIDPPLQGDGNTFYRSNFHVRNNHETNALIIASNGGTSVSIPPKAIGYFGTPTNQQVAKSNLQWHFQVADPSMDIDCTFWNPEFYAYDIEHDFTEDKSTFGHFYLGTYIDENRTTNKNPAEYEWNLVKGNDAINVILTNESEIIPTDNNGNNGIYANAQTEILIYEGSNDVTEDWSFSGTPSSGIVGKFGDKKNKYLVTDMTVDSGYVDLVAKKSGYSDVTRRFTVTKNKKALDGNDAISYWGNTSTQVISRKIDGSLFPSEITITSNSKQGTKPISGYLGRLKVYESIDDGKTWTVKYTSTKDENSYKYVLSDKTITNFKVEFYLAGSFTTKYDEVTGIVVKDGEDGDKGEDAYSIILSNESVVVATDPNGNNGIYTNASSQVNIYKGVTDDTSNWSISIDKSQTITGTFSSNIYTVTNMTSDSGYVRFVATKEDKTLVKDFTLVKNKKATDGQDSVSYWLITGSSVIKKDGNGVLNPQSINITANKQKGSQSVQVYLGYFTIEESINNGEWTRQYTSINAESLKIYTPTSSNISGIRVRLYFDKALTSILDEQVLSVVEDGKNPLITILNTPDGNTIKNDTGSISIISETYHGSNLVTPDSLSWYKSKDGAKDPIAGDGWERITASTDTIQIGKEKLTVSAEEIINVLSIKSIVNYNNLTRQAVTSLIDVSDPLQLQIIGSGTFKNGTGANTYIAKVYQAGIEVDSDGSKGTYTWSLRDKDNNQISGWGKTGKQVTLDAKDFVSNAIVVCQVDFS